jgi:hypothetical protein
MARCCVSIFAGVLLVLSTASAARAAHPLITDDSETQGTGKFQLELNGNWTTDRENTVDGGVRERNTQVSVILSAGVRENIDLVLTTPYQWIDVREDGFGDTVFELKWRFFEHSGWSFGLKPGIIIPTADDDSGLGAGKVGYSTYFILQWEREPWEILMNLGYKRNENNLDERQDLWHASLAAEYEIVEHLELAGNIGVETSADKGTATDPAFLILGVIYEIRENLDFALGVKYGLNKSEANFSLLPGIAVRF